ncbi:hypothetical protein FQ707_10925 [Bacteroidaceae bacterium HV4-6-C5C]|nr:hypothetical protein FQ707_10925 [Bacteroidaceae bacterium HV4-6-C5C]
MNKLKFVLLVFVAITLNCNKTFAAESDSLLVNIQKKVYNSFLSAFKDGNADKLVNIEKSLDGLKQKSQIITYWKAYGKYYESLYYLKTSDKKKAMSKLNDAIKTLDNVKDKNSESLALLAYLQSFSIQYLGGPSAALMANKVKSNAQLALQLDSANLRAWYVLASNDYYTPVAFGGGKKCEKYLLKALSLNEQTIPNTYMPSWGKAEAYSLLVDFYYNKADYKKAKKILSQALASYSTNYMINQYVEKLKDK